MLNRDGNENCKQKTPNNRSNEQKTTLYLQHTFLYISLPLVHQTKTWNFLVSGFTEEMSYVWSVCFLFF